MGLLTNIGKILINLDGLSPSNIPGKDLETIKHLLKIIVRGGTFGITLALGGISLSSLYANQYGMAVVMLLSMLVFNYLGEKQLNNILIYEKKKPRAILLWQYALIIGILLTIIGVMGFVNSTVTAITGIESYWKWLLITGIPLFGLGLWGVSSKKSEDD